MEITKRLKQFIDYKGITKYEFHKVNGFSNGFLDKDREIGTDKCAKILENYPEINPMWLIAGKGEMIRPKSYMTEESINAAKEGITPYGFTEKELLSKISVAAISEYIIDNEQKFKKDELFRVYIESLTMDKLVYRLRLEYLRREKEKSVENN